MAWLGLLALGSWLAGGTGIWGKEGRRGEERKKEFC